MQITWNKQNISVSFQVANKQTKMTKILDKCKITDAKVRRIDQVKRAILNCIGRQTSKHLQIMEKERVKKATERNKYESQITKSIKKLDQKSCK